MLVILAAGDRMPPIATPMKTPAFPQRRILVVDDEPLVCDAVKMMLEFDGHVVQTAGNGKDALAMFGDELAAAIKARAPRQPVVMITAYAEMLQASGNPLTGVDLIISKPFLLENLREAIAKVTPPGTSSVSGAS